MAGGCADPGGRGLRSGGPRVADVASGRPPAARRAHGVLLAGGRVLPGSGMGSARDMRPGRSAVRRPRAEETSGRVAVPGGWPGRVPRVAGGADDGYVLPASALSSPKRQEAVAQATALGDDTLVPKGGLEPPRGNPHYALNVARLPVPPLRQCVIPSRPLGKKSQRKFLSGRPIQGFRPACRRGKTLSDSSLHGLSSHRHPAY